MPKGKIARINGCAVAIVGTLLPGVAQSVQADVKTFGDTRDATVFGTSANTDTGMSNGIGAGMFAGADGSKNKKRSLVEFDVAGNIPAGAHITDVQLTLVAGQVAGAAGGGGTPPSIPSRAFTLFDLNQPWTTGASGNPGNNLNGGGQGTPSGVGDTSWDYASVTSTGPVSGIKWNDGTNNLHGGNFSTTPSAVFTVTANAQSGYVVTATGATSVAAGSAFTWDSASADSSQMLADVQNWLDNPSSNDGWMLRQTSAMDGSGNTIDPEATTQSALGFWTREGAAANNLPASAPALTVSYTVPEPASAALTLLVAPTILQRRRRSSM